MLRLARVLRILRKYEEKINLAPVLGLAFTLACILFAAHLLACFYYLVGTPSRLYDLLHICLHFLQKCWLYWISLWLGL